MDSICGRFAWCLFSEHGHPKITTGKSWIIEFTGTEKQCEMQQAARHRNTLQDEIDAASDAED